MPDLNEFDMVIDMKWKWKREVKIITPLFFTIDFSASSPFV